MQKSSLEAITKWLRQSGMKVNNSKIEICLFYRRDCASIQITINNYVNDNTLINDQTSKLEWMYPYTKV